MEAQKRAQVQEVRRKLAEEPERMRGQDSQNKWGYFKDFLGPSTGSMQLPDWWGVNRPPSYPHGAGAGASPSKNTNLNRWTPRKALDQYNQLAAKFNLPCVSKSALLEMSKVPWLVLHAPGYKLMQVDYYS